MTGCDIDYADPTEAPTKLHSLTRERALEMMRELEPLDDLETEVQRPCALDEQPISGTFANVPHVRAPSIAPRLRAESRTDSSDEPLVAPQPLIRLPPRTREIEIAIGVAAFLVVLIPSLYLLFR